MGRKPSHRLLLDLLLAPFRGPMVRPPRVWLWDETWALRLHLTAWFRRRG